MNLSVSIGGKASATVGNSPGWHLSFHPAKQDWLALVPDTEAVARTLVGVARRICA